MPIQVAAHGFEITDALRTSCIDESRDKLQPLALQSFSAKWTLSLERGEHIAHVTWVDGGFKGDATSRTKDMYGSIRQTAKKAMEQMKRAHDKRYGTRPKTSGKTVEGEPGDESGDYIDEE